MHELPSQEELLEGRMKDGSRPPLHSRHLYERHTEDAFGRKLPEEINEKSVAEMTVDELEYQADLQLFDDLDYVRRMGRFLADQGHALLESGEAVDDEKPNTGTEATAPAEEAGPPADVDPSTSEDPPAEAADPPAEETPPAAPAARPRPLRGIRPIQLTYNSVRGGKAVMVDSPVKAAETEHEQGRRMRREADLAARIDLEDDKPGKNSRPGGSGKGGKVTRSQAAGMIQQGCALILKAAPLRREVLTRLIRATKQLSLKEAFYWDRAHAVVAATLLSLDKEFREVGFGSWMPFRYPDQWLMFCGLLRKVLAANGLIHAKDPEQYRRLLEETEPVEPEIKDTQERIKWWKTPENWSTLWLNRGARDMPELYRRLMDEVWDPTTQFGGTRAPPETPP